MSLVSKVYLKWLWLSTTYPFLWAHKPLCTHFKKDVLSVNGVYLCRSCSFAYSGAFLGAITVVLTSASSGLISFILVALLLITLPLSYPSVYRSMPRSLRDILRFNLGLIVGLSLLLPVSRHNFILPLIVIGISALFWGYYYQQRRVSKIRSCENCSEYGVGSICSGYRLQAELIREYEIKATEYLYKKGCTPKVLLDK
jgi:hypothetical protein